MRETWVQSLGWEDPLEKGKATDSSILAWRILYSPWGGKESDTTEQLSLSLSHLFVSFHGSQSCNGLLSKVKKPVSYMFCSFPVTYSRTIVINYKCLDSILGSSDSRWDADICILKKYIKMILQCSSPVVYDKKKVINWQAYSSLFEILIITFTHTQVCIFNLHILSFQLVCIYIYVILTRLPWCLSGKESACQRRRHAFDLWSGKIPWRRK